MPETTESHGDRYEVHTQEVSGQVVVGRGNTVSRVEAAPGGPATAVTEEELAELRAEFARVRALVPADEPEAERAVGLLDELEEAVTAPEADLSTMAYVRQWFARRLPVLAGAVASLVIHPVVGRLVEAAGGRLVEEFDQRFGE
ncbi:hypothetical protein AB0I22_23840 [Streptomyces sp. NPDC050610]|uniref:hypothetical protein n=1 Tax=Streptomyces sp. NPDC050610 TaxID=3157097 RepID=UPI00342340FD